MTRTRLKNTGKPTSRFFSSLPCPVPERARAKSEIIRPPFLGTAPQATVIAFLLGLCFLFSGGTASMAAKIGLPVMVRPDQPNVITFDPVEACYVRLVIHASNGSQPCLDEIEIYGADQDTNLALAADGAKPTASSCLSGYTKHAIKHLNDGQYGNDFSWIAAGTEDEWAQIQLAARAVISKVVFSRDRSGQFTDRVPTDVEVQVSLDDHQWQTVAHMTRRAVARSTIGGEIEVPNIPAPPPAPAKLGAANRIAHQGARTSQVPTHDNAGLPNLARESGVTAQGFECFKRICHSPHTSLE